MDPNADIESVLEVMDEGEMRDALFAAIYEALGGELDLPNQPPCPPLSPATAGLELNLEPQPVESQGAYDGACIPMGADPPMPEQHHPEMAAPTMYDGSLHQAHNMQPAQLHGQTAACSQGQFLPYQWPVNNVPTAPAVSDPAAPQQTFLPYQWPVNNVPTAPAVSDPAAPPPQQTFLPYKWPVNNVPTAPAVSQAAAPPPQQTVHEGPVMNLNGVQGLRCVGVLNGEMVYKLTKADLTAPVSASPPLVTSKSKKRKREDDRQYVKKPPNAFMLFLKEQRSTDEAKIEFEGKKSTDINAILGQRWSSLTAEQQSKYFEQATIQRKLHNEQYPDWSSKVNYGKNKTKIKMRAPSTAEASASKPEEATDQANRQSVTPVQTARPESTSSQAAPMQVPLTQTGVMESRDQQTDRVQLPHTRMVHDVSSAPRLDFPATASMLASPAAPTPTQTKSTNSEDKCEQLVPLLLPLLIPAYRLNPNQ